MKILQLVQKPQRRGAEIFALQLTRELRRQKQEVRIAYLYPHGNRNSLPLEQCDIQLNGKQGSFLESFPGIHPVLLRKLTAVICSYQPDIVQANGSRTVKYGAFARSKKSTHPWRLVYRNIGNPEDWLHGSLRRFFYQTFVMPKIDAVVGVSQQTLKKVLDFYDLTVPSTHIARGVDATFASVSKSRQTLREELRLNPDSPVVLFVGSLTQEKRPDRFLKIIDRIKRELPQIRGWIIGDGILRGELNTNVSRLRLEENIQFFGTQDDIAPFMNAADVLLLTSDTEGIPGVVLEAGMVGLPVVASAVGGVSECVLDQQTGILVKPEEETRMTEAVITLLKDSMKRKEMGSAAKNWVIENFEMGKIASKYLEFYNSLLAVSNK